MQASRINLNFDIIKKTSSKPNQLKAAFSIIDKEGAGIATVKELKYILN